MCTPKTEVNGQSSKCKWPKAKEIVYETYKKKKKNKPLNIAAQNTKCRVQNLNG